MRTCQQCSQEIPAERSGKAKYCTSQCSRRANRDSLKTCSEGGCARNVRARGLCPSHYNQQYAASRHLKVMTPCFICDKPSLKFATNSKARASVCSEACRVIVGHGVPLPEDHWARWWGKSSEWPKLPNGMTVDGLASHKAWSEASRSPLAVAVEERNHAAIITLIKADCTVTDSGCWEWNRIKKDGYGSIRLKVHGKSTTCQVHRLTLEAKMGKKLGKQAAHHMCANPPCVNPMHLQPVTHAENTAEMLARGYYLARIDELEKALAEVAPRHELLTHIGVKQAA